MYALNLNIRQAARGVSTHNGRVCAQVNRFRTAHVNENKCIIVAKCRADRIHIKFYPFFSASSREHFGYVAGTHPSCALRQNRTSLFYLSRILPFNPRHNRVAPPT